MKLLDVVALLADENDEGLTRGETGTVVELLDHEHVLVEFADEEGVMYAMAPLPVDELLVLHYKRADAKRGNS